MVIVTRKAADEAAVEMVHRRIAEVAPSVPRVSVHLVPAELIRVGPDAKGESLGLEALRGKTVRALLSIGDPRAFVRQMESLGARVNATIRPDHYAFSAAEIASLTSGMRADDIVVCTLKDAVKLAPLWPRLAPPLWYVSQQVMVERGVGGLEHVLDDLVRARSGTSPNAG